MNKEKKAKRTLRQSSDNTKDLLKTHLNLKHFLIICVIVVYSFLAWASGLCQSLFNSLMSYFAQFTISTSNGSMIGLVMINVLVIAVAYLCFGIITRRMRRRLKMVEKSLKANKTSKTIADEFSQLIRVARTKSHSYFWGVAVAVVIVLVVGFDIYAHSIEPRADIASFVFVYSCIGGIGFIGYMFILGSFIATVFQILVARKFLRQQQVKHPSLAVINTAQQIILPRFGELGVSLLSFIAVIASLFSGLIVVAVLFSATQAAIECARSPKCL